MSKKTPLSVIKQAISRCVSHSTSREAAELTYYLLFSLFPLLMFVNTLLGRMHIPIQNFLEDTGSMIPADVMGIITDYLDYLTSIDSQSLFYTSIGLTLYMIARALRSLTHSVSKAYNTPYNRRSYFVSYLMSLLLVISIIALLVFTVISGSIYEKLEEYLLFTEQFTAVWDILGKILVPLLMLLALTAFYKSISGKGRSFVLAIPGTMFFSIIWFIATNIFTYYVSNMARYNILYGSIGAVMILMVWLNLTSHLLILGGELNSLIIDLTEGSSFRKALESKE